VDIYLYDEFDNPTLSTLLAAELDLTYPEAGYHSVPLDPPVALTAGNEIYATIFFSNSTFAYTVPADSNGPHETQRTWISDDGTSWLDLGANKQADVAIRIRTTHPNGGAYALQGEQCGYDTTTCPLYDDGTHGDAFADDHIHSRDHTVDTPLAAHNAYVFYRLDGDKTLPSTGNLEFGALGSCPLYLLAQGNPYGITVTDCDAYAHVTCDTDGSSFGPVSLIGNEDFAEPAETLIEEGTALDLRVEIYAPGLTDGGTATAGEAIRRPVNGMLRPRTGVHGGLMAPPSASRKMTAPTGSICSRTSACRWVSTNCAVRTRTGLGRPAPPVPTYGRSS